MTVILGDRSKLGMIIFFKARRIHKIRLSLILQINLNRIQKVRTNWRLMHQIQMIKPNKAIKSSWILPKIKFL